MKRTLSILLALILVLSAVSFTAFAADDDLASSGEDYGVRLGDTKVTDENKDDILGDGGRAKYDPDTYTLTLNEPFIGGTIDSDNDLTIKGRYHMTESYGEAYGLYVSDSLTLDGDFSFIGDKIWYTGIVDQYYRRKSLCKGGTI